MHAGTFPGVGASSSSQTAVCLSLFHCAAVLVCNETFLLQGRLKSQTPNKRTGATHGAGPPPVQTSALPPFSSLSSRLLLFSPPGSAAKQTSSAFVYLPARRCWNRSLSGSLSFTGTRNHEARGDRGGVETSHRESQRIPQCVNTLPLKDLSEVSRSRSPWKRLEASANRT